MTSTLRRHVASSMPVPRPVTSSGGAPVNTAASALAAVVLRDPHLADAEQADAVARQLVRQRRAGRDRGHAPARASSPGRA